MQRNVAGISLAEGMMTAAIVFVLGGLSPAATEMLYRARADSAEHLLHRMIALSRSAAITRNTTLTFCGSDLEGRCQKIWARGTRLLIFEDANRNRRWDDGEWVFHTAENVEFSVRWRGSGGRRYQRFRADGSAIEFGAYFLCGINGDGRYARQISVNAGGRAYTASDDNADGVREDNRNGDALGCR